MNKQNKKSYYKVIKKEKRMNILTGDTQRLHFVKDDNENQLSSPGNAHLSTKNEPQRF